MFDLLQKSDPDLKQWLSSQDTASLGKLFAAIDTEIRSAKLIGGQPRSVSSASSVELARLALRIAEWGADETLLVEAWRMLAYSLNGDEQHELSLFYYDLAIPGLEKLGNNSLAARTRLGYMSALNRSGRYQDALKIAAFAERWFREAHDDGNLAKLYTNVANVYNRLYQPEDAYRYQVMAGESLHKLGDPHALANYYCNLANALSNMDQYERSDEMYAKSEEISLGHGFPELGAMAAYNRAYLYFLRGRYSEALQGFARLRAHFEQSGSSQHHALCDLDESEIYLQLNLSKDAATLARRAIEQFESLHQNFELAKAKAFLGVALMQMGRFTDAHQVFQSSQTQFEAEGNLYWAGVLDLYRAEVHTALKRFWEARSLVARARERFTELRIPSKRTVSLVLLGRISLLLKDVAAAEACVAEIRQLIEAADIPLLLFPYYLLRGDIAERKGDWLEAEKSYEDATEDLEVHQARLHHDDLRVTFFKGRNRAYEELVWLKLQRSETGGLADAYAWCERSKSRGLIELLAQHLPAVQSQRDQPLLGKINRLREELNVLYIRSQPELRPIPAGENLRTISNKESELARTLREVSAADPEYASLQQVTTATLESVQEFLPVDTTVVEYFVARDEVLAFILTRDNASIVRHLCPLSRINDLQQRLAFQLEKFMLGHNYLEAHSAQILKATMRHLSELYQHLVAGLHDRIRTPKLTIIPHATLHLLPFHAFFDGTQYLIDEFEISYAPSASVLKYCLEKEEIEDAPPILVGVRDAQAPHVEEEVRAIARMVPEATVMLNQDATREKFSAIASRASFVHIATHAIFRQDNPMFSGFKLQDGWVTAFDLFSMTCQTNLVTLSGCKSGMSQVTGSDDLLGLTRGFLYAGARSLMVSLWNVDDETTSQLMTRFYHEWRDGSSRLTALTKAMKSIRNSHPNPFYWAPFMLIGKP